MPSLRQRLVQSALRFRASCRNELLRGSVVVQRRGPVHRVLRDLYLFSRRHPVDVHQWDEEYSGDYTERLETINHVAHHAVIMGYLTYGTKKPTILDVGCGHGRLLRLLAGFDFAEYVGMDWSSRAVEQARSLSIPNTRFEIADMNHWETTDRFDAVVLNNCLSYADDPSEMFHRALGWLAEDGIAVVAMYRGLGAHYIWTLIQSQAVEKVAACTVRDERTGAFWDIKVLRPALAIAT